MMNHAFFKKVFTITSPSPYATAPPITTMISPLAVTVEPKVTHRARKAMKQIAMMIAFKRVMLTSLLRLDELDN